MDKLPPHLVISDEISRALKSSAPIVALESTVITHGLPHPQNLSMAVDMETEVRTHGASPATVAVLGGKTHIGLSDIELKRLASASNVRKISRRDFATAILRKESGGTTVAGTLFAAHRVGIKVFATGGIGGVHEVETFDISPDLLALSDTPMIVVCSGAKAILDLPATLEFLETVGVPVVGYQTSEFPAFYSRQSGLPVSVRLNSPEEVVDFAKAHWEIGMHSAILVCQPLPVSDSLPHEKIDAAIRQARKEVRSKKIRGQEVTPFLLQRLLELTDGASLRANIALLLNNARLAAQIARVFSAGGQKNA